MSNGPTAYELDDYVALFPEYKTSSLLSVLWKVKEEHGRLIKTTVQTYMAHPHYGNGWGVLRDQKTIRKMHHLLSMHLH